MQLTQLTANDTLLTYSLVTSPSPVSVSPQSGPPSLAALSFVISCPVSIGEATVTQISFNLPVGDPKNPDASDLTETTTGISPSVSSSGADQWQIGPGAAAGTFVLKPASGTPTVIGSQGLTVTFTGIQVSPIVGTALVNIVELATPDSTPPQPRQCIVAVPKFPYAFFVGNFEASAPMIQHGATVTLSWLGSVQATYTILWAQQSQDVSKVNQWTSPDLTDTTTFILQVSAQEGGQTVTIQFSVTVIVADPDITVTTLDVLQTSTLAGAVTIGSSSALANLALNGDLNATGSLNAGGNVSATGNLSANGSLTVSGTGTMPNLNVAGTVQAGALSSTGNLSVSGAANTGNLSTGYVSTGGMNSSGSIGCSIGVGNAFVAQNNGTPCTVYTVNSTSNTNYTTGIYAMVATSDDSGLVSNGRVGSSSGSAFLTHLPTRNGHRVVTSPLAVEAQVQASGSAKLVKGKALVQFEPDVADIVLHRPANPYRVLLTPTGHCKGLVVVNKSGDSFVVEELENGKSNAGFDWFIIARTPNALGATKAKMLPAQMPGVVAPKLTARAAPSRV